MKKEYDTANICEEAHKRTIKECRKKNITVNCEGCPDCDETGEMTHYSDEAQDIFNKHFDEIEEEFEKELIEYQTKGKK